MFCRWSAASLFGRDSVYEIICFRDSLSSGSSFESCGSAHSERLILAGNVVLLSVGKLRFFNRVDDVMHEHASDATMCG